MTSTLFPDSSIAAALDLHSPQRQLIELKILHADLDALIDHAVSAPPHLMEQDLHDFRRILSLWELQ